MESISDKEYYSIKETYKLLYSLIDPAKTPHIPKYIRDAARKCVRDFPIDKSYHDMIMAVDFWNPRQ